MEGSPSTGKRTASNASSWKLGRKSHPELNNANAKSKIELQRSESAPKVDPEVGTTESQVANMKFQARGCWCGKQQHSRTKQKRSRFRNTREALQQQPDPGHTHKRKAHVEKVSLELRLTQDQCGVEMQKTFGPPKYVRFRMYSVMLFVYHDLWLKMIPARGPQTRFFSKSLLWKSATGNWARQV